MEELILAKDRPERKAQRRKLKRLLLFFGILNACLQNESSPVEKIVPDLLCGMKASFERYLKNYGYSIMRDKNLQNKFFGLGVETIIA